VARPKRGHAWGTGVPPWLCPGPSCMWQCLLMLMLAVQACTKEYSAPNHQNLPYIRRGEGSSLTHTIWGTTPHYLSSYSSSFSLISNSTLEQGLSHQGRLVSLEERILGMNSNIVSSKVMSSYLSYSCAIELEYSFHVIILHMN
jgi:hypothetical protein